MIRELNAQDTKAFLALKRRGLTTDPDSFVATLDDDPPSYPEMVRERLRHASVQSGDIVLGAFAPDLIGIIAITRDGRTKRQHKADLHGMYVVPEHRGQGLGRTLLAQVPGHGAAYERFGRDTAHRGRPQPRSGSALRAIWIHTCVD